MQPQTFETRFQNLYSLRAALLGLAVRVDDQPGRIDLESEAKALAETHPDVGPSAAELLYFVSGIRSDVPLDPDWALHLYQSSKDLQMAKMTPPSLYPCPEDGRQEMLEDRCWNIVRHITMLIAWIEVRKDRIFPCPKLRQLADFIAGHDAATCDDLAFPLELAKAKDAAACVAG